jgi:hypothetical protein
MKTTINTELENILNSDEFNAMFNIADEQAEIANAGWSYKELASFGNQLAKQIK